MQTAADVFSAFPSTIGAMELRVFRGFAEPTSAHEALGLIVFLGFAQHGDPLVLFGLAPSAVPWRPIFEWARTPSAAELCALGAVVEQVLQDETGGRPPGSGNGGWNARFNVRQMALRYGGLPADYGIPKAPKGRVYDGEPSFIWWDTMVDYMTKVVVWEPALRSEGRREDAERMIRAAAAAAEHVLPPKDKAEREAGCVNSEGRLNAPQYRAVLTLSNWIANPLPVQA